ncbi:MAG TPA: hypothetical protein VL523_19530, partial [Terriglobia bacterium]|nr:hypothetical protein [Terriglobia bacterium]
MALVKSPQLSAAKLAANRDNAQKSTGPRTLDGKARCALNALKYGRFASSTFRKHLLAGGDDVALYDWLLAQILAAHAPRVDVQLCQAERAARWAWCTLHNEPAGRSRRRPAGAAQPGRSAVWCVFRIPRRLGGDG